MVRVGTPADAWLLRCVARWAAARGSATVSVCLGMTVPPPEYAHARSLRRQRERSERSQPCFRQLRQRVRFVDLRTGRPSFRTSEPKATPVRPKTRFSTTTDLAAQRHNADALVDTGRRWARTHHDLVIGSAVFADGDVWIADGARSAAHWLADRLDVEACTVRDWIRVGRALRGLDASAAAYERGELSYAKVRALVSVATASNEEELLDIARRVPAAQFGKALAAWSLANEDHDVIERRHTSQRSWKTRVEPDGMVVTTIRQPPLVAAQLAAAVEAEVMRSRPARETDGGWPSLAQQRCDAFHRLMAGHSSGRFELIVHVDHEGNRLPDGTPLTDHAVTHLLDRASIRLLIHDAEHHPINATRATRRPTVRQKRVAHTASPTCVNCGSSDLPNLHHTTPFATNQRTHTGQLELLCAPCHRTHHRNER